MIFLQDFLRLFKACAWPRGKGLGGSSNLNFMIWMRGHPQDFNVWADYAEDSRWSYEQVLPFFKKMEDYEGEWDSGAWFKVTVFRNIGIVFFMCLEWFAFQQRNFMVTGAS